MIITVKQIVLFYSFNTTKLFNSNFKVFIWQYYVKFLSTEQSIGFKVFVHLSTYLG